MRLPRVRFTIRWMMAIAGVVAGASALFRSLEIHVDRSAFSIATAVFIDPMSFGLAILAMGIFLFLVIKRPSKDRNA